MQLCQVAVVRCECVMDGEEVCVEEEETINQLRHNRRNRGFGLLASPTSLKCARTSRKSERGRRVNA